MKAGEVQPLPTKFRHRDRTVRQLPKRYRVERGRSIRDAYNNACDGHRYRSNKFDGCECFGCEESFGPVGNSAANEISQSLKFRVRGFRVREIRQRWAFSA